MRPVSEAFLRAIRGSHRAFSRVTVVTTYQEGTQPTGTDLTVLKGTVTADAQASIRGRCELTVDGRANPFPSSPTGLLTPYGNEVFVQRGIEFGNGTIELVTLGYYRLYTVEQDDAPDGPIQVTAFDRMSGIVDARLEAPAQFPAGTSVSSVFDTLVHEVYPTATIVFDYDAGVDVLQTNHIADQDRYKFLNDLAKSRGKVWFWDYKGQLRVQSPPDPASPVFQVNGGRDGVLVSLSRTLNREGVYNVVVATGEQPSADVAPVRAVARDNNPNSPTYAFGRFGPVPKPYSSPFITTVEQAASAAQNLLQRTIGLPYSASFEAVPNPALEALDPVQVVYPGRWETHVLESVTIPLNVEVPMTATTREQSTVQIDVEI